MATFAAPINPASSRNFEIRISEAYRFRLGDAPSNLEVAIQFAAKKYELRAKIRQKEQRLQVQTT